MEKSNGNYKVLSNVVKSQIEIHKFYGGVVPELAARAHSDIIDKLIVMALSDAKLSFKNINAISAPVQVFSAVCWWAWLLKLYLIFLINHLLPLII